MLEYEKALHFDKQYEKLQKSPLLKLFWISIRSIICYTLLFYLLKMGTDKIPDLYAWRHMHTWITMGRVSFIKADIFYYAAGLVITCYASFQLDRITVQNHSVKRDNNKTPERILNEGYYAKKRHPMYGTFLLFYIGLFLSFRSLDGMLLAFLMIGFQYLNAVLEEKRILKSELKDEYQKYKEEVRGMLFDKKEMALIAIFFVICMVSFVF